MKIYRHVRTGAEITIFGEITGEDWEEVEPSAPKKVTAKKSTKKKEVK